MAVGKLLDKLNQCVTDGWGGGRESRGGSPSWGRPGPLTGPSFPSRDVPDTFRFVVSEQLGRSTYKERYLFVFRYRPQARTPRVGRGALGSAPPSWPRPQAQPGVAAGQLPVRRWLRALRE
ncbi:hypothetical protein J0S82_010366 [Galemys pyrenaicus]|uniref:Uncharacterized protein n=1 Tax=Galemys pyrenaicus TaxID=202257 RepID=A0A8J6A716_GALPY|nr:hypothetical protein J0S82_010366 [Galemys pyrenaicus]